MTADQPDSLARALHESIADSERFGEIYDALVIPLMRFFVRRVDQQEIAADLVSETFALALERRRQFRGKSDREAAGWIFGIAKRQLADFHRRGAASKSATRRLQLERPPVAEGEFERLIAFEEAVSDLPAAGQEVLNLRYAEDLSYPEIAGRLEISEENARARVSRSVSRLRKALGGASNA